MSGPQALQWPKHVNLKGYNMVKLLGLVGMQAMQGGDVYAANVRQI